MHCTPFPLWHFNDKMPYAKIIHLMSVAKFKKRLEAYFIGKACGIWVRRLYQQTLDTVLEVCRLQPVRYPCMLPPSVPAVLYDHDAPPLKIMASHWDANIAPFVRVHTDRVEKTTNHKKSWVTLHVVLCCRFLPETLFFVVCCCHFTREARVGSFA